MSITITAAAPSELIYTAPAPQDTPASAAKSAQPRSAQPKSAQPKRVAEKALSIDIPACAKSQLAAMTDQALDADWKLTDFFGCIYVISLRDAAQRRERVTRELQKVGVQPGEFEFFDAVNGRTELDEKIWKKMHVNWSSFDTSQPEGQAKLNLQFQGEAGCYMSHLGVIKTVRNKYKEALAALETALASCNEAQIRAAAAQVRKYSSVLILEDDNGFGVVDSTKFSATLTNAGVLFRRGMQELPENWDMLYLMSWSLHSPAMQESGYLAKLNGAVLNNAFAVNHVMYDILYDHLDKINDPNVLEVRAVDDAYSLLHKDRRCYGIIPSLAYQQGGLSAITSTAAPRLRQMQSYPNGMVERYGNLPLESLPSLGDEACLVSTLRGRLDALKEDNGAGFQELNQKITLNLKDFYTKKRANGEPHQLSAYSVRDPLTGKPIALNASLVSLDESGRYLMHECPPRLEVTCEFLDAALRGGVTTFVTTLESYEDLNNTFWKKEHVAEIKTKDGWTFEHISDECLSVNGRVQLTETKLKATGKDGEIRELTWLHYDGWTRGEAIPDRKIFQQLLDRMCALQDGKATPIAIGDKWSNDRSGAVAASHYLRQQVVRPSQAIDTATLNIPNIMLEFRKQRDGFAAATSLLADIYEVTVEFVESRPNRAVS